MCIRDSDDFEPIIKARDPRTVPEFVKLTNGKITQTAALAAINKTIDKDATIITAGGSLPSCMPVSYTHLDVYKRQELCIFLTFYGMIYFSTTACFITRGELYEVKYAHDREQDIFS